MRDKAHITFKSFNLLGLPVELVRSVCASLRPKQKHRVFDDANDDRRALTALARISLTCRFLRSITQPMIEQWRGWQAARINFEYIPYALVIICNPTTVAVRETEMRDLSKYDPFGPLTHTDNKLIHKAAHQQFGSQWHAIDIPDSSPEEMAEEKQADLRSLLLELAMMHAPNLSSVSLYSDFEFYNLKPDSLPSLKKLRILPESGYPDRDDIFTSRVTNLDALRRLINAANNLQELQLMDCYDCGTTYHLRNLRSLTIKDSILDEASFENLVSSCTKLLNFEYISSGLDNDLNSSRRQRRNAISPAALVRLISPAVHSLERLKICQPAVPDFMLKSIRESHWCIRTDALWRFERLRSLELSGTTLCLDDGDLLEEDVLIDVLPKSLLSLTLLETNRRLLPALTKFEEHMAAGGLPKLSHLEFQSSDPRF